MCTARVCRVCVDSIRGMRLLAAVSNASRRSWFNYGIFTSTGGTLLEPWMHNRHRKCKQLWYLSNSNSRESYCKLPSRAPAGPEVPEEMPPHPTCIATPYWTQAKSAGHCARAPHRDRSSWPYIFLRARCRVAVSSCHAPTIVCGLTMRSPTQ